MNHFPKPMMAPIQMSSQKTTKVNSMGPEYELPPPGTKCLVFFDDSVECWHPCEVIGTTDVELKNNYLAVVLRGKHEGKLIWANAFKPLKTDREPAVETTMKIVGDYHKLEDIIGHLYDLGILKLQPQPMPALHLSVPVTTPATRSGAPFPSKTIQRSQTKNGAYRY